MTTLRNPTDAQLDAAFAEHICGWERIKDATNVAFRVPATGARGTPPPFARSADAVLPWLEKQRAWVAEKTWHGQITVRVSDPSVCSAEAATLPRAAVIALLMAHGVEVAFDT